MEVTVEKARRRWVSPQVKTATTLAPPVMLACSPATQWDCDAVYPGCGCVRKSADQQTDCDNTCGI